MLGTRERTLLLDSLRPPAGYRLRRAIGTTFTLDLMALLTAPLAFTFFEAHDEDGAPVADPVALLEALRRHAENITLFCQAGAIGAPKPGQSLLAFLENSVIEVQPRQPGVIFHPKLWFLNFVAQGRPAIYRVLCLSRNLTFARAWDTCLRLEGRLGQCQRGYERNNPLREMLRALPDLATRPVTAALREDLERMSDEIRRVDFKTPRPFRDFRVHNFGLCPRQGWPFPKGGRSLAMSPYLIESVVADLRRDHGLDVLISRPEALEDIARRSGPDALPERSFVLSSGAHLDSRDPEDQEGEQPDEPAPSEDEVELSGLHAKLFLFENGSQASLFTGSANATRSAFNGNVEVLVELVGKTKYCGIKALLGQEDDSRLDTLRSLLQKYQASDSQKTLDDPRQALEKKVDQWARKIGATHLTAKADQAIEGQLWDLTLSGDLPAFPEAARIKVWPVTLQSETARNITRPARPTDETGPLTDSTCPIAVFPGVSFEALTAFFAFEVSIRKEDHEVSRRFAVTALLTGVPADRKQRLLRSILKDRRRVLQLLFLILMGEGADVSAFVQAARDDSRSSGGSFAGWDRATLLEALLRCLSRRPERIDEVARLIADLEKTPEGEGLLPEGLNEIWAPVRAAREKTKR